jgi:hypothetical protein
MFDLNNPACKAALVAWLSRSFTRKILRALNELNTAPGDALVITREIRVKLPQNDREQMTDLDTGEVIWPLKGQTQKGA